MKEKPRRKEAGSVKKALLAEEREKRLAEDIWLNYLNRYLFESGTISEKEYNIMPPHTNFTF